jgi:hypothetical protein
MLSADKNSFYESDGTASHVSEVAATLDEPVTDSYTDEDLR